MAHKFNHLNDQNSELNFQKYKNLISSEEHIKKSEITFILKRIPFDVFIRCVLICYSL